ncbi:MAG: hypothetical protein Q8K60_05615 [Parachlamydiaceae bacterium]|nr:hypothetical protein [Parachlamydiaceae bacterium]
MIDNNLEKHDFNIYPEKMNFQDKKTTENKVKSIALTVFTTVFGGFIGGTIGVASTILTGGAGFSLIAVGIIGGAALGGSAGVITNLFFYKLLNQKINSKHDFLLNKFAKILKQINTYNSIEKNKISVGLHRKFEKSKHQFSIYKRNLKKIVNITQTQNQSIVNLKNVFYKINFSTKLQFLGRIIQEKINKIKFFKNDQIENIMFNYRLYEINEINQTFDLLINKINSEFNKIDKEKLTILKEYILFLKNAYESNQDQLPNLANSFKNVIFIKNHNSYTNSLFEENRDPYFDLSLFIIKNAHKFL